MHNSYLTIEEPTEGDPRVSPASTGPHSTPIEGYLDKPFLDQTSPRLKKDGSPEDALQLEKNRPKNYVPAEGAVIPEVITRQRVIGPKGRDHNATVTVVVPMRDHFNRDCGEKNVASIEVPNTQAGSIAAMLADTIAAMAFENKLMVEEQIGQGIPVDPNDPLGGLGWSHPFGAPSMFNQFFNPTEPATMVDMAIQMGILAEDPSVVNRMMEELISRLPEADREKGRERFTKMMEILNKAKAEIEALAPKEEGAATGTPSATFPDDNEIQLPMPANDGGVVLDSDNQTPPPTPPANN